MTFLCANTVRLILHLYEWECIGLVMNIISRRRVSDFRFRLQVLFYVKKKGNFLEVLFTHFSTFHEIKTKAYIRNLRHSPFDKRLVYAPSTFHKIILNIKEDVLAEKIKVQFSFY